MPTLQEEITRRRTSAIIVPQKLALFRGPRFQFAPGQVNCPSAKVLPPAKPWTAHLRRGSVMAHTLILFWRMFHV